MKSIFLSPDQVFTRPLPLLEKVGAAAPATDLALLSVADDGFLTDNRCINYYLDEEGCVSRFGLADECAICAVRPVLQLEDGEESLLGRRQQEGSVTTVEYGRYPYVVLDESLRQLAEREYARGALPETGRTLHIAGKPHPVYRLGAKELVRVTPAQGGVNGFVRLFAGSGGLSAYPVCVSNLWQDLTGRGIYGGKGIYDVAAFQERVEGRLPPRAPLLLEYSPGAFLPA